MAKSPKRSEDAEAKPGTAKSKKAAEGKAAGTGTARKATSGSTAKSAKSTPDRSKTASTKASSRTKAEGSGKAETKATTRTKTAAKKTSGKTGANTAATKTSASKAKKPASSTRSKTAASRRPATAEKPWLKSYPAGTPTEIAPLKHESLADLLCEVCRDHASEPAFTCMDKTITYGELEKASRDFAAHLQSLGLDKGARVAVMMPNVLQYPVVMMAILRAGCVVVNVNPLYTSRELEHQLADSGAEAIVILENFAGVLQEAIGETDVKHVVVATMGDMLGLKGHAVNFVVRHVKRMVPAWSLPGHVPFRQAMREGAAAELSPRDIGPDDLAFLQYTGGTTGVAKGAMLLHRNLLANVEQNVIWLETAYADKPKPERVTYLCALPLYHVYAMTVNALTGMRLGAHNVLVPNPRDIPALVKEFKKHDINVFPGVNTLFNAVLNNEEFRRLDFRNLALAFGGGMAVQRSVAERWKEVTGQVVAEGYGLSETSPVATATPFDKDQFMGSIGLPLPSTEVAIRDENEKDVKSGEVGEICIRGPQVMAGYWNKPEETKAAMTADGFFKSGDLGTMDNDGYTRIVDRKKDMILVSGFNVYPNEIEDVVAQHPGVLEVAAVGVQDEHSGEVPKVFIVKKDAALTEKNILDFCHDELTGYKRPKHVEFRDTLPKSNVGKILRRELR